MKLKAPLMLVILDGFGHKKSRISNAIAAAKTPFIDSLFRDYPNQFLDAAGEAVGLPRGFIGNSEVNHLNIGAGRIVYQDMTRISNSISDRSFFRNKVLKRALGKAKKSTLHLMGLLSDGGVHSHISHLYALLKAAKDKDIKDICIHCFMDGRDTPTRSGIRYLKQLQAFLKKEGMADVARVCTISGRFYAMDRDNRWQRVKKAYDCLVNSRGRRFDDPISAIKASYRKNTTDEFVVPCVIGDFAGISSRDTIIHFNFRSDRAREVTHAFTDNNWRRFRRKKLSVNYYCMCEYDQKFSLPVIMPPLKLKNTLSEFISRKGYRQLKIAETEKFVHVTFFFNGQRQKPWPLEDRIIIPSPKVRTYDVRPEMSAFRITDRVISELDRRRYDVVIMNYANADMVGHTGSMRATIKAIQALDSCLKSVVSKILSLDGTMFITADHGNAEEMKGDRQTTHTMNKVPLLLISNRYKQNKKNNRNKRNKYGKTRKRLKKGSISDIAPTMLKIMGLKKPAEMKGKILV